MKTTLEARGSNLNLFYKGLAREVDDLDIVAATLAKPGVVLQRPVRAATRTRLNLRIGPP
jgi:colicin import membrane protein